MNTSARKRHKFSILASALTPRKYKLLLLVLLFSLGCSIRVLGGDIKEKVFRAPKMTPSVEHKEIRSSMRNSFMEAFESSAKTLLSDGNILISYRLTVKRDGQEVSEVISRGVIKLGERFILLSGTSDDALFLDGTVSLIDGECVLNGYFRLYEQRFARSRVFELQNRSVKKGSFTTAVQTSTRVEIVDHNGLKDNNYQYKIDIKADWAD